MKFQNVLHFVAFFLHTFSLTIESTVKHLDAQFDANFEPKIKSVKLIFNSSVLIKGTHVSSC